MTDLYLTAPQAKAELEKCLQCAAKPCMRACPACVSPKDFIAYAKSGNWLAAAKLIQSQNPMGEICGLICPDSFCMKACVRAHLDAPIRIPPLQALIMQKARTGNWLLTENHVEPNGKKIAVIGTGPAGIGATSVLLQQGCSVTVFEKNNVVGGALNLIPQARLPREIITYEWQRLMQNPLLTLKLKHKIQDFPSLIKNGFDGVVVAVGEQKTRSLGIDGEEWALSYTQYLANPENYAGKKPVAVIGGGAVAVDCAITAKAQGSQHVEMFVRRRLDHMRITQAERQSLLENGVDITTMTRPVRIQKQGNELTLWTSKTRFNSENKLEDIPNTTTPRTGFGYVILALGSAREQEIIPHEHIVFCGDFVQGGSTAVQAIADGKKAAQELMQSL